MREHLIVTPQGRIAWLQQVPGNRHDVHGLYALLKTPFRGALLGDCAYQPNPKEAPRLKTHGIRIHAAQKSNARNPRPKALREWLHQRRSKIERRIALFDDQFHATRTRNRSRRHYEARRWTKALAHNAARHINAAHNFPLESVAHFNAVA